MEKWAKRQNEFFAKLAIPHPPSSPSTPAAASSTSYPTTLIILHDELESPLGKLRVKRGGPESASLRGHRGLISICETLRGKGLYPRKQGSLGDFSILRVGVGIGRPASREKGAVAEYVLAPVSEGEMRAYHGAAEGVVKVIGEELYRE